MTLAEQKMEALRILRGCECGATLDSLALYGIKPHALSALVNAGKLKTWVEHLHKPRLDVQWYAIRKEGE